MHLFYTPDILQSQDSPLYTLNEEESKHCIRVLRLTEHDTITLVDGQGGWYTAQITDANPKRCTVNITEVKRNYQQQNNYLHIAIAPTKSIDRTEWFIEKATETGINEISIINCKNSERTVVKSERLTKVAVSAMKQSLKACLPVINEMADLKKFITSTTTFTGKKFIAHCYPNEQKPHLKNLYTKGQAAIVLIGPEGDFTPDEVTLAIENGYQQINLGQSRLRTETAALYACTVVNSMNEN